jgi:hypothetical protein
MEPITAFPVGVALAFCNPNFGVAYRRTGHYVDSADQGRLWRVVRLVWVDGKWAPTQDNGFYVPESRRVWPV